MDNLNKKLVSYIGTYTSGQSKGIYRLSIDEATGEICDLNLAAEVGNPTYLCINKNNSHLYSVAKIDDLGGVASFRIDSPTLELTLINHQLSSGNPPCHVSLDRDNNYAFSANYHKGTVEVFPIEDDGSLETASSLVAHHGSGPNKERQEKPHAHYSGLTPDERYLCVIDLGIDKLILYSFKDGIISESSCLAFPPGSGPRHLEFHPSGRFAYLLTELSSELFVLDYDSSRGSFSIVQSLSTLPESYSGENLGGAVHISPDGRYVYTSNRGHDSISAFSIDAASGRLELASFTPCGGSFPRDFAIEPGGRFMYVANQNSSNIVPFSINKSTGGIAQSGLPVSVPNPVCVKFLNP